MSGLIEILKELMKGVPVSARILLLLLIITFGAGYFYVRELWNHEEKTLEIMNKYASEKVSLEIALENCQ